MPIGVILPICFGVILLVVIGVVLVIRRSRQSFREYTVSSHLESMGRDDDSPIVIEEVPIAPQQTEIQTFSEVLTFADDQQPPFEMDAVGEGDNGFSASRLW